MKHLLILTVGICLLISVPAIAAQAADEVVIREVVKQLFAAMGKHDAEAYVALCDEDFEMWEGDIKGHAATEKYLSGMFSDAKDIQFKLLDEIGIVFVTSDVAIYKHYDEVTGRLDDDGKSVPPFKRLSARVFVKKNGKWLYVAGFHRPIEE